jgi:hypothetical protein
MQTTRAPSAAAAAALDRQPRAQQQQQQQWRRSSAAPTPGARAACFCVFAVLLRIQLNVVVLRTYFCRCGYIYIALLKGSGMDFCQFLSFRFRDQMLA